MWWTRASRFCQRLTLSEDGSIAPIFGLCIVSILAVVGATIALGMDTRAGHQLQVTADASALGGATVFLNHASPKADERLAAAHKEASVLATNNSNYTLRDLAVDAVSEDAYGQHTRLAVELEFEPVNYFTRFAGERATAPMRRRAVATATWGFPLCVLTLEEKHVGLRVKDQGVLSAENCIVWSNSSNRHSMSFEGGTSRAKAFCTTGDVDRKIGATVEPQPEASCQALPDPLADLDMPASGVCDSQSVDVVRVGSTRLLPGMYCGGLTIRARNVTLDPGVYFIRDGGLKIDARGSLDANGVTFIFMGTIGQIDLQSGSDLKIIAPTDGETAGIAFAQVVSSLSMRRQLRIRGDIEVEGVIYMPSYDVRVTASGGGRTKSPYLQLVSNTLEVAGDGRLQIDFDMSETDLPLVIEPKREARLVE